MQSSKMASTILMKVVVVVAVVTSMVSCTPLDEYVNTPDPNYSYTPLIKYDAPDVTVHILNMTSQKWFNEAVSSRPIWWHYLCVIIPKEFVYTDSAFLWIDQGSNHDGIPDLSDQFLSLITMQAASTKSVAATIKQIPNQPIVFPDDPSKKSRSEDSIIAWTWMKFIRSNGTDPNILLRLPMTKAVVRGMDTVADYTKKVTGNTIDKFVVGGASKRGWTTWTVAAVDKRVVGAIPVVMDLLNLQKNLHHHYRSLGGWTFAFDAYYEVNITKDLDNPNMQKMIDIIDPLSYSSRYTMPKLIMTAGGDEFFLPDDSHYYYDQLQGPKYLRRDFRLLIKDPNGSGAYPHPVVWFKEGATKISDTEYEATMDKPKSGWTAFFISLTFDSVKNTTLDFTTETCIVPDVFPFPDCTGDDCRGKLV